MPREYRHIKQYEKEILEMREKGATRKEIAERCGFTKEQGKGSIKRHSQNQRKLTAGIAIRPKGTFTFTTTSEFNSKQN